MLDEKGEEKLWFDLYMNFNDYNALHAELAFIANGYTSVDITAEDLFKANQEFIQEIIERGSSAEDIIELVPEAVGHFPKN